MYVFCKQQYVTVGQANMSIQHVRELFTHGKTKVYEEYCNW